MNPASAMQVRQLIRDDDAVSPVIGVILMVAITVILAAVIASFVLGLGGNTNATPQASFSFDYDASTDDVTVTHDSGDPIEAQNIVFRGENLNSSLSDSQWNEHSNLDATQNIQGGMSTSGLEVGVGGNYTLRLVYETEDTTSTLQTDEGPNA